MFRVPTHIGRHLGAGGTLLVPSRQRLRAVQLAYAAERLAAGAAVWASPDVLTVSGWARRECLALAALAPQEWPRVLGSAEEWLLWRQAADAAAGELVFLDRGTLADSLQQASELAADYGITPPRGRHDSEAGLLYEAQRLFQARCRELQAAPVSALLPRLSEHPGRALLLRGFDALPPRLAAIAALRSPASGAEPHSQGAGRAVRSADAQAEQEAIALWCRERLLAQQDARLLVVLPGPAGPRERLAALIRGALDPGAAFAATPARAVVAVEGGEPFAALPLPSQALRALALLAGAQIDFESLGQWLTAPFWASPTAVQRAQLLLALRQRGFASLGLRELRGALQLAPRALRPAARELDALLRRAAAALGEGSAAPRRWAERCESALAALTWPGALVAGSAAHQTRLRWRELLDEFGGLAPSVGVLERGAALELLAALARRTAYRPADDDVPVTLSPMLADPVVHYDGIWVASLSAEVLPQPLAPNPFLPLASQAEAGVPAASRAGRRRQAAGLLAAWRAATPDLVLSVPARSHDLELLPSTLLGALTDAPAAPSLWLPLRLRGTGAIGTIDDDQGPPWNPLTPLPAGTRAITLQNSCPFRAFVELRLGAVQPEHAEPGIAADQRGLLLHAALQALWERLGDSAALEALSESALEELIGACVGEAARLLQAEVRGRRRRHHAPDGQFDLFTALPPPLARECRRARALIATLCALERTRDSFTVLATEHPLELQLGGGRLRMRLDRIDRVSEGRMVLDYKSGRPGSPDWFGERPTHPQLLAYLTALGSDVVALATVNITAREVRFTGVAAGAGLLPKVKALPPGHAGWESQQHAWRERIASLIRAFLAGEARVDPAPGACDYCHLKDVCRIGAHRAPEPEVRPDEPDE